MPKLHDKAIIRLDIDEVAMLLDYVESAGEHLTGQALAYYQKTMNRDLAILTLLLGTGIRVSECVGLNLTDVDFKNNTLHIRKTKFSKERYIPIHKSVTEQLCSYHQWIEEKLGLKSSKDPFFYTTGGQKID